MRDYVRVSTSRQTGKLAKLVKEFEKFKQCNTLSHCRAWLGTTHVLESAKQERHARAGKQK